MSRLPMLALLFLTTMLASASTPNPAILSADTPEAVFDLPACPDRELRTPLIVTLNRVHNPTHAGVSLEFGLSVKTVGMRPSYPPVAISTIGFYPPDQPGRYVLDLGPAWLKLRHSQPDARDFQLHVTLRSVHPQDDLTRLRVVVTPPKWQVAPATGEK